MILDLRNGKFKLQSGVRKESVKEVDGDPCHICSGSE